MSLKQKTNYITYCKNKDIRVLFPNIKKYVDPLWSPQNVENYLNQIRQKAHIWVNNQLEAFELETIALDNDKNLIESKYAIYLILSGSQVRASREIINDFKESAMADLRDIEEKKTSRKHLNSKASRMTRNRTKFKDYGNLGD